MLPKLVASIVKMIGKLLKSFFRQVSNLPRRDQAEISRTIILAVALVSQTALLLWALAWVLDKSR